MKNYDDFIQQKTFIDNPTGFEADDRLLSLYGGERQLFDFQRVIVKWALRRGRAAIFADTGLGKTAMQVAWANAVHQYTGNRVLILAPLCVAQQTVAEAALFGNNVRYVREFDKNATGIFITNYEMLEHFVPWIESNYFDGVVLDESSILKSQDSKTRTRLIQVCSKIPYRLSCTATPSPNDHMELGNQAEFLGVMSMVEMLSMFFTHDSGETSKWRLKGHGRTRFWEWLSNWAVCIQKPSDFGFSDAGYNLPPLEIEEILVTTGGPIAQTLSERNEARRETIDVRVAAAVEVANASKDPCVVWCNLNDESAKLTAGIPDSVEVKGSDKPEQKEDRLLGFTLGMYPKIVSKPSIAGFGLNWQHCSRMVFVGLNDSYEQLYQAIRRCYRFGQTKPVKVTLITADREGAVLENIKRKEAQHREMSEAMVVHMREFSKRKVLQTEREKSDYKRDYARGADWELHLGDCVEVARELPDDSLDFSVFSPPFASLYTYSNSDRDMGNCRSYAEFFEHFTYLTKELFRALKPGRNISIHCMNLPTSKQHHGYIGIQDFRGDLIRLFQSQGFIFHSEVCVWKDPVVAMQRTKALGLLWKTIKKDSSMSRQGVPDHVVTFRKPGINPNPVSHTAEEFPVKLWQELASPCWMDIRQSNTLNRKMAREEQDERHICPLQLDLIERVLFLWTKPGDIVFSPFAGIGSEGYAACAMGRHFIGAELKRSYFELAVQNLSDAPRANYRFPIFSDHVGKWFPESIRPPVDTQPRGISRDGRQLDWTTEGYSGSEVMA